MYPHTSYIIYATARSGSYLLCEALANTHLAGNPTEHFSLANVATRSNAWGLSPLNSAAYLQGVYAEGTTSNGVFGTKIIWQFFEEAVDLLRDIEGNEKLILSQLLSTVFPGHRAIMTTRRDKVRQAISFWKAIQTSRWVSLADETSAQLLEKDRLSKNARAQEPIFDFQAIENLRYYIVEGEKEMQEYFLSQHIQPFIVVYEDFVHTYEETALQILDYLQIPVPNNLSFSPRKMQKQSNEQTEEWIQLYYQMKLSEKENNPISQVH